MLFTKRQPGETKKGATFKNSLKKTIKITYYLSLILLFYIYFYPPDSLTYRKLPEPLHIEQLSSYYIDLFLEMTRYCCPVKISYFVFF